MKRLPWRTAKQWAHAIGMQTRLAAPVTKAFMEAQILPTWSTLTATMRLTKNRASLLAAASGMLGTLSATATLSTLQLRCTTLTVGTISENAKEKGTTMQTATGTRRTRLM